jgi:hypothetical protein
MLKPKPEQDEKTGRFVPGNNGGGGRPKGSRNRLGEAFLVDLYADWKAHGIDVVRQVREENPAVYLKIVSTLVSDLDTNANGQAGVTVVNVITGVRG